MNRFAAWIGVCAWALIACIPIFLAADAIVWLKTAHASHFTNAYLLYQLGMWPSTQLWGWQWLGLLKIVEAVLSWPAWSGLLLMAVGLFTLMFVIEARAQKDWMFFKRGKIGYLSQHFKNIAWDDRTLKHIADSSQINVQVTNISKTVSLGQMRADGEARHQEDWEVFGVITSPKLIWTHITFTTNDGQFGGFSYNTLERNFREREANLPLLEIWLYDPDEQKAKLLRSAMYDALVSGRKSIGVRFWKAKGDGLMT